MLENNFKQFEFDETMMTVINKLGFKEPTTVQQKAIPMILAGQSVVGQSHTGSGKTHAFLLPLLSQIQTESKEVQIVITSPTRELATQLYNEVKNIISLADKEHHWIPKLLVGGSDKQKMAQELQVGS